MITANADIEQFVIASQRNLEKTLSRTCHANWLFDEKLYQGKGVGVKEMAKHWKSSMHGSMMDSLEFFRRMRDLGIASHYWI